LELRTEFSLGILRHRQTQLILNQFMLQWVNDHILQKNTLLPGSAQGEVKQ